MIYDGISETDKHIGVNVLMGVEGRAAMQLEKQKQREKVKEILKILSNKQRERERDQDGEDSLAKPLPLKEVYL